MKRTLVMALLLFGTVLAKGPEAPLLVPDQYTQDANRLADYLTGAANVPRQKAERIYNWIAANINYDLYMLHASKGAARDCSPPTVLKRRQSVCAGYAGLSIMTLRRSKGTT